MKKIEDVNAIHSIFGCDCFCLNHIAQFVYYIPEKDEKGDENDVIFLSLVGMSYHSRIIPPIFPFWKREAWTWDSIEFYFNNDLRDYFRWHYFHRIYKSIRYLCDKEYQPKKAPFQGYDFRNDDLKEMYNFLSCISEQEPDHCEDQIFISNNNYNLRIEIYRVDSLFPYALSWDIFFLPKSFWGRIKTVFRYLIGEHFFPEHEFNINKWDAGKIKNRISKIMELNKNGEKTIKSSNQ